MEPLWCIDPALLLADSSSKPETRDSRHKDKEALLQLLPSDRSPPGSDIAVLASWRAPLELPTNQEYKLYEQAMLVHLGENQPSPNNLLFQQVADSPLAPSSTPSLDCGYASTRATSSASGPASDTGSPMSMQAEPCEISDNQLACVDDMLWQAVLDRDPAFVGVVWHGVRSTKIYCRPTCPSRRPAKRANILFYASCSAAEDAGYRACRRCMPRDAQDPTLDRRAKAVASAKDIIEHAVQAGRPAPSLPLLAEQVGISQFHLHRVFKQSTGMSPKVYEAVYEAGLKA